MPERQDTSAQGTPKHPHLEDGTPQHRGTRVSTPERQDTSAQGVQDMYIWKTGQDTSAHRGLGVFTPENRAGHLSTQGSWRVHT